VKKIVLAYSGGLDTSVILKWLSNSGFEVFCFIGNVGQKENFQEIEEKALKTGASDVTTYDLRKEFVTDFIFPALKGNALYEGRYLLGTSLARPILAKAQVEMAKDLNAEYVGHGSTGKGNDQVRFELAYYALNPDIKVIAPWKDIVFLDQFKGRNDLISYAKKYNIPIGVSKKRPYSEDENLMHISHEAGMLEDPNYRPEESVFSHTSSLNNTPNSEEIIIISFKNGIPTKVINESKKIEITDSLKLFLYLNDLGSKHGIGRLDMVENRFIGIKSRGIYETPAGKILWTAHRDIEGLAMDKEVMHIRDSLIPKFSELIYNGLWYSPEMDFIMSAFNKSQEEIDGDVTLSLFKGNVTTIGRKSPTSLYDQDFSSMDKEGGFDAIDAKGFINIHSIRLKAHNLLIKKKKKSEKNSKPFGWRNNTDE